MNGSGLSVVSAVTLAMTLFTSGCMTDPGHGDIVGPVTQPIRFFGYYDEPGRQVQIRAQPYDNGVSLSWELVGHTTTSTAPLTWEGRQWYPWRLDARLPRFAWRYGYTGARATISTRHLLGGPQDLYTMVPDFWGCFFAHPTFSGLVNNCLSGNGIEADITTSDFCEGPVVPWLWGSTLGQYQASLTFWKDDQTIRLGVVQGSPSRVQVGGATCTFDDSSFYSYSCPLFGSGGVFEDAETAALWLEHPEPGLGSIGYTLSWSVEYSQPFGPPNASCYQTAFTKQGRMPWQSIVDLRDHVEDVMSMNPDSDGDNIPDVDDECDSSPETYNGFEDHDGCPDVEPAPECYLPLPKIVCGVGGAAPAGHVVTGITRLASCNSTGTNAKYVVDYTTACSGTIIQVCNGYDGPPGWPVIEDPVVSIACATTAGSFGWARRVQKP